ncbi:RNA polymerase sigma factor [bacterium]|jgi:RNA polymerase sigma-70 factor, ECF subfamily|nr:RNA polymerase sigma factor [bacterium]MBT4250954.1 RNA polymerase sigma factor [bacterium]MBT4597858.1 RNA polymerase sigma factor [bacterium]MBT6753950.1 RNA polymerase sigma factor [bacterium]MBT7037379.1 RNA polymerase sigma factor [bacterium]
MNEFQVEKSDEELVELSKNDPDVFGELVKRYEQRLFGFVRRISYYSTEDIEDIIQDTFIKVYKNLNAFDSSFKFSSWIYRIARNTTFDAIRKKHARPQAARLEEEELIKIFRSGLDLEKEIIANDDLSKVKKIIDNMPIRYKEIFVLKFIEEKSYEEIMDIVKKPKGTIATLISRGRKIISKEVKRQKIILN